MDALLPGTYRRTSSEFLGLKLPDTARDAAADRTTHRLSGHQLLYPHRSYGRAAILFRHA